MNNAIDVIRPMFLSIKETVKVTGLSEYYLRQNIKAGKVPYIKSGNKILINMPRLSATLDDMTDESLVRL